MNYDEFVGQVQHRARLGSTGDAMRAIGATLETLGERLHGGEAENLAAQLPEAIGHYLGHAEQSESFGLDTFYDRVSQRAGVDKPDAVHYARVVLSVVQEAVSGGELQDMSAQLPEEYAPLFEYEEAAKQED